MTVFLCHPVQLEPSEQIASFIQICIYYGNAFPHPKQFMGTSFPHVPTPLPPWSCDKSNVMQRQLVGI